MNIYTYKCEGKEFKVREWGKRNFELNCYQSGELVWSSNEFLPTLEACTDLVRDFLKNNALQLSWSSKVLSERLNDNKKVLH